MTNLKLEIDPVQNLPDAQKRDQETVLSLQQRYMANCPFTTEKYVNLDLKDNDNDNDEDDVDGGVTIGTAFHP